MKTKFHYLMIITLALALSASKANAQQTLIQYWDFNQTMPVGGGGGDSLGNATNSLVANQAAASLTAGTILYSRPTKLFGSINHKDSDLDNGSEGAAIYDYSNSNDTGGTAIGNVFIRARNPSDSGTLLLTIPTTGYKNIQLQFVISASSSKGANYGLFSYSTNGGTSWNNLTQAMDTFNIGGVRRPDTLQMQNAITATSGWYPVQINFSADVNVNNNANFVLRIMMAGVNTFTQTGGNARFDNFAVWGTSTTAGINDLPAQAAGYSIYPNPATDAVNIISSHYTGAKIITLYNVTGQIVNETETYNMQTSINTSSLNAGIYFVEIKEASTGNKYTEKIVKE